jgi:hypothetical protein
VQSRRLVHQSKSRRVSGRLKSVASKVMWVGRATVFAVGLVVILALLFALANMVFGTGGKLSIVGESDQTGGITQLVGSEAGAERVLDVDPVAKRQPQ